MLRIRNNLIFSGTFNTIACISNGLRNKVQELFNSDIETLKDNLVLYHKNASPVAYKYKNINEIRKAAVLVPICFYNQEPSILFTLRTSKLTSHAGEISFPGGKSDPSDISLLQTALRETEEEIGISPDKIQIIGSLKPVPNYDFTMKIFPYIGLIKEDDIRSLASSEATGRFNLKINFQEVEDCFTIPIKNLINNNAISTWDSFRNSSVKIPRFHTPPHITGEIWGLTSFILYSTLKIWFPVSFPEPKI